MIKLPVSKRLISLIILIFLQFGIMAQAAYEHITNTPLYSFIDELASNHLIEVNSAIKPYSRQQIANWLEEANRQRDQLTKTQQARLDIFIREFSLESGSMKTGKATLYQKPGILGIYLLPPEIVWRDTLFRAVIRPIYGIRYFNTTNSNFYHSYGGAEAISYIGNNWAVYASLRDNYQNKEILARPNYLTLEQGGNYKINEGGRQGGDFSEMRGGFTYSWKWGSVGLIKDHIQWGDNNNGSNILSGRTPSFPLIKLHLNPVSWLEFNYFHGWLVSEVIDSTSSYIVPGGIFRGTYYPKYIAANMYTFKPLKRLNLSVGNAIIYDNRNVHPAYLIPFFFYKSLVHTINRGILNNNSTMFLNVSSRQIKHLHLFGTLFIDEFSKTRVGDPDRHNFWSYKAGLSLSGWPVKNIGIASEMTRTSPMTYQHRVPTTTFETNRFNLGHYLRDNASENFICLTYAPIGTLELAVSYTYAYKGNLYSYVYGTDIPVDENPILKDKTWSDQALKFRADLLPLPNVRIFTEYISSTVNGYDVDNKNPEYYLNLFTPNYLQGKTSSFVIGFSMGL